jgi:hypothetical protein
VAATTGIVEVVNQKGRTANHHCVETVRP